MRPATRAYLGAMLAGLALASTTWAKPPTWTSTYPAGARQGTTVRVKLAGSFDHWPPSFWTEHPGVRLTADAEKGYAWLEVAADTPPGLVWARLHDEEGPSAPRRLAIGALPEVVESEPNEDPASAQRLDFPAVTINGRLSRNGDVDGFSLPLRKGETLVASMEANRRLGSPMDGLLQVARPDGIVLAENDDDHDRDPQLVLQAPADGLYVVRTFAFPATPDSRIGFTGKDDFIYRLTLTTRGFVDHAFPLAVTRGHADEVRGEGWNLDDARLTLGGPGVVGDSTPARSPALGNVAEVRLVPHATVVEAEPNAREHPQPIEPPISVSGRLANGADVDAYRFPAKKGERLSVRVESRSLGQPVDPTIRVVDASGKTVAEADDTNNARDAELTVNPSADGPLTALVRDLNEQGGPRAVYLLTVEKPRPDYRLELAADRFTVAPGKSATITITVKRINGFEGVIELRAEGLPKGVAAAVAKSEARGSSAKSATLALETAADVAPWSGPIRVIGTSGAGTADVSAWAKVDGYDASIDAVWLSVTKAAEAKPASKP